MGFAKVMYYFANINIQLSYAKFEAQFHNGYIDVKPGVSASVMYYLKA